MTKAIANALFKIVASFATAIIGIYVARIAQRVVWKIDGCILKWKTRNKLKVGFV